MRAKLHPTLKWMLLSICQPHFLMRVVKMFLSFSAVKCYRNTKDCNCQCIWNGTECSMEFKPQWPVWEEASKEWWLSAKGTNIPQAKKANAMHKPYISPRTAFWWIGRQVLNVRWSWTVIPKGCTWPIHLSESILWLLSYLRHLYYDLYEIQYSLAGVQREV
jgi:Zn-finger protein